MKKLTRNEVIDNVYKELGDDVIVDSVSQCGDTYDVFITEGGCDKSRLQVWQDEEMGEIKMYYK